MSTPFSTNSSRQPVHQVRPYRSKSEISSTGEILTLEQAQYELGIDPQAALLDTPRQQREDEKVNDSIAEARMWCEAQTERTLRASVQREVTYDDWPDDRIVEFWDPPLISVETVEYRDEDGTYQTIDPAQYRLLTPTDSKGILQFVEDWDRPDSLVNAIDILKITYTSGYGDEASIPPLAKAAAKLMLSLYYDYDESAAIQKVYLERAQSLIEGLSWGSYE